MTILCFSLIIYGSVHHGEPFNIKKFNLLKDKLSFFPNEVILDSDYEKAASFYNLCRTKGIQGSHVDYLICAVAYRLDAQIYTVDKDFMHYQGILPIQLMNRKTINR